MSNVNELYEKWLSFVEGDLKDELIAIKDDPKEINERFYKELAFGTGGLRGCIGCGTNRMNIYTVGLAAQGLALWVKENSKSEKPCVVIAHDSRIKSDEFARESAVILAANGVTAYLFENLEPVPVLSYAVRKLGCDAGIVITASHNPAKYNGFKCYGSDGGQMTDKNAHEVEQCMASCDIFEGVKRGDFDEFFDEGLIKYIDDAFDESSCTYAEGSLMDSYVNELASCSVNPEVFGKAGLRLLYTPLFGAGCNPVRAVLKKVGVKTLTLVEAQSKPNGSFPGLEKPNPEYASSFDVAKEMAKENPADLVIATDPDSDRVGIAVPDGGDFVLFTGNEVGAMLLDYLLSSRKAKGTLPENPVAVKSIVSTALADRICADYGCELRGVLTGFKYIGEIISQLQEKGEADRFVMGFEESYGYLTGCYARDKDGVLGAMLITEMASYYKLEGKTLIDVMKGLYGKYGFYRNLVISEQFEGAEGVEKIAGILKKTRENKPDEIAGVKVVGWSDYLEHVRCENGVESKIDLPASNVLEFRMADNSVLIMRPSGTEPLIKFYYTAACETGEESDERIKAMAQYSKELVK